MYSVQATGGQETAERERVGMEDSPGQAAELGPGVVAHIERLQRLQQSWRGAKEMAIRIETFDNHSWINPDKKERITDILQICDRTGHVRWPAGALGRRPICLADVGTQVEDCLKVFLADNSEAPRERTQRILQTREFAALQESISVLAPVLSQVSRAFLEAQRAMQDVRAKSGADTGHTRKQEGKKRRPANPPAQEASHDPPKRQRKRVQRREKGRPAGNDGGSEVGSATSRLEAEIMAMLEDEQEQEGPPLLETPSKEPPVESRGR